MKVGGRICLAYTLRRSEPEERPAGPHRAPGRMGADPTNDSENTYADPAGLHAASWERCSAGPRQRRPVHREAVEQEGRPALPHPPRPPSRVDRVRVRLEPILADGARGSAAREGRSPLGGPLPWGMAGDTAKRVALRRPQALSSARADLREGLTPPPALGASPGSSAPDFRTAQAPDRPGPANRGLYLWGKPP